MAKLQVFPFLQKSRKKAYLYMKSPIDVGDENEKFQQNIVIWTYSHILHAEPS